jgi:DNA-binding transcriptional regulator YiaG
MRQTAPKGKTIGRWDATALIGLPVTVIDAAIEVSEPGDEGGPSIAIPALDEFSAAAALVRCQMKQRLRGAEVAALRKIAGFRQRALSEAIGGETAVETISRWETGDKPVGTYIERLVRIAISEAVKDRATGVTYSPAVILRLPMAEAKRVPRIALRRQGGRVIAVDTPSGSFAEAA